MQIITLFLNRVVRNIVSDKGLISETPIIFIREIFSEVAWTSDIHLLFNFMWKI